MKTGRRFDFAAPSTPAEHRIGSQINSSQTGVFPNFGFRNADFGFQLLLNPRVRRRVGSEAATLNIAACGTTPRVLTSFGLAAPPNLGGEFSAHIRIEQLFDCDR